MKNKLFLPILIICLLFSACRGDYGKRLEVLPSDSSGEPSESAQASAELAAKFPELDDGLESLKILMWGSHGWYLYSAGEYLFAAFGNYLVRYSIAENKVDSVVEFDYPENWWCDTSASPDGETAVAKAGNHPDYNAWTNQILVDFKQRTCESVSDEFNLPERETDTYSLYRVEKERAVENNKFYYKLYARDNNEKYKEIWSISQYAVSLSEYTIIDENRMGIIMGASDEANGYLGYDKFVVIDIAQDKIIQECVINEWDGYGREYWAEKLGESF